MQWLAVVAVAVFLFWASGYAAMGNPRADVTDTFLARPKRLPEPTSVGILLKWMMRAASIALIVFTIVAALS